MLCILYLRNLWVFQELFCKSKIFVRTTPNTPGYSHYVWSSAGKKRKLRNLAIGIAFLKVMIAVVFYMGFWCRCYCSVLVCSISGQDNVRYDVMILWLVESESYQIRLMNLDPTTCNLCDTGEVLNLSEPWIFLKICIMRTINFYLQGIL